MASNPNSVPNAGRAQRRVARSQEFVDAALQIAASEGLDALTMNRLASECDAAVSAVYRYFPSKGAVVAELQHGALERLADALADRQRNSEEAATSLAETVPGRELLGVATVAAFMVDAATDFPMELRLFQSMMSDQRELMTVEEGMKNLPLAMSILGGFQSAVDLAVAEGALLPGVGIERVIAWTAAVSGVLELNQLSIYDAELFDGTRIARQLNHDLLLGWGADPDALAAAEALVQSFRAA